jgi:hypothetical protein
MLTMILSSKQGLTYAQSITFSRGTVKFIISFKIKELEGEYHSLWDTHTYIYDHAL